MSLNFGESKVDRVVDTMGETVQRGDRIRKQGLGYSSHKTSYYLVVAVDHDKRRIKCRKLRGFREWTVSINDHPTGFDSLNFRVSRQERWHKAMYPAKIVIDMGWRKRHSRLMSRLHLSKEDRYV